MTAREIYNKAMTMLGYFGSEGISGDTEFSRKGITAINLVIADLWPKVSTDECQQIKALSEEIKLPEKILADVMPYGVAMFLAQSEGDGDSQQMYAVLYNRKRIGVNSIGTVILSGPYVDC